MEVKEMEKISGIVPASARVKSVNLREGQPVRPGAPPFGRPMGKSALAEQNAKTTAEKAMDEHNRLMQIRSGDKAGPEIITDMADRFFMQRSSGPGEEIEDIDVNYKLDRPMTEQLSSSYSEIGLPGQASEAQRAEASAIEDEVFAAGSAEAEVDDYTPPGTYLDVTV